MTATLLTLGAGSAWAGPGLAPGHDDTVYADDQLEQAPPRRVPVTITDQGPQPRFIPVQRENVQLIVTRASPRACRSGLAIEDLGVHAAIPPGAPVVVSVLARGDGQLHLTCPAEDVVAPPDAFATPERP
ncbi:MAG TPA: hypothetical protein VF341_04435 [Anaeromyxobacteraceae bacterium]